MARVAAFTSAQHPRGACARGREAVMATGQFTLARVSIGLFAATFAVIALPAAAHEQRTLRFEVEALDLDANAVLNGGSTAFAGHPEGDVAIAYNSDVTPHAVVLQNADSGVALARL